MRDASSETDDLSSSQRFRVGAGQTPDRPTWSRTVLWDDRVIPLLKGTRIDKFDGFSSLFRSQGRMKTPLRRKYQETRRERQKVKVTATVNIPGNIHILPYGQVNTLELEAIYPNCLP
jgi:hypothetical protein